VKQVATIVVGIGGMVIILGDTPAATRVGGFQGK
jgi:hypothetical protein